MGNISRDGRTNISASGGTETAQYWGSWWGFAPGETVEFYIQVLKNGVVNYESVGPSGEVGNTISDNGVWSSWISIVGDTGYSWRVNHRYSPVGIKNGPMQWFTSAATAAAFGTQSVSNPGQAQLNFSGQWYPNTAESTATAYLYYKKTTDPGWTLWGNSGAQTGYGVKTYAATVTGLTAGTSYQFYLYVTRTTSTGTTASGPVSSGSTLASTPVVTTEVASSVSSVAATLNGTIDANSLAGGVDVSFQWNTQAYRQVAYQDAVQITAGKILTLGSQVYYFKANAVATGDFNYSGQPAPSGDFVDIEGDTYNFKTEATANDGVLAYVDATPPTAGKIVTIPTLLTVSGVYTFVAAVAVAGDVKVEATADATMLNLTRCINKSGGTEGVGNDYIAYDFGAGAAAHPDFIATSNAGADQVTLAAQGVGPNYNVDVTTDETTITVTDPANGSWVAVAGDVLIGATEDDTFLNLARAINNSGGTPGVGNDYMPIGGAASQYVSAVHTAGSNVVDLTALEAGAAGNNITLTESGVNISVTVMSGGADLPGTNDYEVLIENDSDGTMLNFARCVNKSGGTEGISYNALAVHPYCVAARRSVDDYVALGIETNVNPTLTFTTDEATFTLTTDLEDAWVNETTPENFSNDGTTPFLSSLSGLEAQRLYFFRAKAVYTANGGGTLYGVEETFTTPGIPGPLAIEEEHMQTTQFDGQYGQAKTVTFTLREPAGTSSDLFYTGSAPVQADVKIFKDGVYDNTSDNAPTRVLSGAVAIYSLVLSATEMQAETIDVVVHDDAGSAFRDQHIQARTAMRLSEIDVDATQGPVDATALTLIGNDDGHGMLATSTGAGSDINAVLSSMWLRVAFAQTQGAPSGTKIKLDSNASTTNDYYNGCVVVTLGGDGAGQARVIIGYNGGQREATVDTAWSTIPNSTTTYAIGPGARPWDLAPSAELGSVPGPVASYGEFLQLLFQRFAFKVDQTASAQTWYDSNGVAIFDRSVSDDGVTQTIEALANV